jgi:hypothetical protein
MSIYIHKNDEQFGPFNDDQLSDGIKTGQFTLDDLAWIEGQAEWVPLRNLWQQPQVIPPAPKNIPEGKHIEVNKSSIKLKAVIASAVMLGALLTTSLMGVFPFTAHKNNPQIKLELQEAIPKTFGPDESDLIVTGNKIKKNDALDEKNGFRNFKLGLPFSEYEGKVEKIGAFMRSNEDEIEYFAKDKADNIGKTKIQYIRLIFNQNLLTEISIAVTGKEDGLSLKESLSAAFGEAFENRLCNNREIITWHGKKTKLVYLWGEDISVATYTNDDVNLKVEDIIKQKAKDNSKEGSKSL